MITMRADIVIKVLDGFTGRPPQPSVLRWELDGRQCRPITKGDGYHVLLNLSPGPHRVVIRSAVYQEERLEAVCGGGSQELLAALKPGSGYPFGQAVTRLNLGLTDPSGRPASGRRVWLGVKSPQAELRVAQDVIPAGEQEGRLFYPETAKGLSLPRDFLLSDKGRSELCRVEGLEPGRFAWPMVHDHKRGCSLWPAQAYTADQAGRIQAVFRTACALELLAEGSPEPVCLTLESGENSLDVKLKTAKGGKEDGK